MMISCALAISSFLQAAKADPKQATEPSTPFSQTQTPARSQKDKNSPEVGRLTLDPVTVSATLQAEPLSEIPASVDTFDFLAHPTARLITHADEVTQFIPGVQVAMANGTQAAFQIRGIGAVDHQALTPGAAAIYRDGVFLATNVQTAGLLYDLARVDVLKGPQGTLYGRNAASGVIQFLSVTPGPEQSQYAEFGTGSFNRLDLQAAGGMALSDDSWIRVAGRFVREDPTRDNVQTDPNIPAGPRGEGGLTHNYGLRVSMKKLTNSGAWIFRGHLEQDRGINPVPLNQALNVSKFKVSTAGDGMRHRDNQFYGASAEWTGLWNDWQIASLTALEGYQQRYGFDFDGTPAPNGNENMNANLSYDRDYLQFSQDLRANREFDWGTSLIGATLRADDFSQRYIIWCGVLDPSSLIGSCNYVGALGRVGSNPASSAAAATLVTDIDQTHRTLALYSRNDIVLNDALTLTLGARVAREQVHGSGSGQHIFRDGVWADNNRGDYGPARGSNRIHETPLSGSAALSYRLNDTGRAYFSITNGYKTGGFNGEVQNNALHFSDAGLFQTEMVTAYELGYKAQPSKQLAWSIAGFIQDYRSPQARIFVNFPLDDGSFITSNSLSNLDAATVNGVEANVTLQPFEQLYVRAGAVYLDTNIHQDSDALGNAALFDEKPLPFASRMSATLAVERDWILSSDIRLSLGVALKYRSRYFLDAEGRNDRSQPSFTTGDAEAQIHFVKPQIDLNFSIKNLTNEDYATSGFGFIGYNTFRSDPRRFWVSVRKTF